MNILTKFAAAAAVSLFAGSAMAQGINFDGPLDTDGDGMLSQEEFVQVEALGGTFVAFDKDGDGMVSQIEYNESVDGLVNSIEQDKAADNARTKDQIDELTRLFDQADADRDLLEGLFGVQ